MGVTVTVRLVPEPPKTILLVGTKPVFDEAAVRTRFDAAVSTSKRVKGSAAVGVFTIVT